MCLALPALIVALDAGADAATVTLGGVRKNVSLALLDGVEVGDYAQVIAGVECSYAR
jgi:hydrogenase expression/formation protein HypC